MYGRPTERALGRPGAGPNGRHGVEQAPGTDLSRGARRRAPPSHLGRSAHRPWSPAAANAGADLGLAVDEDPRGEQPGRPAEPAASGPARPRSTQAMRLARTRSNGRSPLGRLPCRGTTRRPAGSGGRRRGVASIGDRIGVEARPTPRPRTALAAIARIPEPQPTSRTRRHAPPRPGRAAAVGPGLDPGQAQPGRRVEPRPERHPGVERDDDVVGCPAMTSPGRPDDEPPAHPEDREVGLPGVRPVLLVDDPRLERRRSDAGRTRRDGPARPLPRRWRPGRRPDRGPGDRRARWPADWRRSVPRALRRRARRQARPWSRRARSATGSRSRPRPPRGRP